MLYKTIRSNRFWKTLVAIGFITMIFGVVMYKGNPESEHNISMLMGMFSGIGGAFMAIGIVKLIHNKRTPAEKLKQEEIEIRDERNLQILRIANSIANTTATILFGLMAFIFVWLDYRTPAFISIGAMYIQMLAFFIAYKYFNKKM
jgi:hypothetical protein